MRKLLLLAVFAALFTSVDLKAQTAPFMTYIPSDYQQNLNNGWYEASVNYNNQTTGNSNRYTLNVYVSNGQVTTISFGGNESVHSGYNSSGYLYQGGTLTYKYDSNGNIIAASTEVVVTDKSRKVFSIYIR
ncbi:MAG: hypothetical protein ACRCZY_07190 [Phocaeicola sp.]